MDSGDDSAAWVLSIASVRAPSLVLLMISLSEIIGGGERDRTDDLLLAKQALSQLSYTPSGKEIGGSGWVRTIDPRLIKTVL